jgi:hypothetical protein
MLWQNGLIIIRFLPGQKHNANDPLVDP